METWAEQDIWTICLCIKIFQNQGVAAAAICDELEQHAKRNLGFKDQHAILPLQRQKPF